jgi:2-hydroxychromene-2-carboxylate isomerase
VGYWGCLPGSRVKCSILLITSKCLLVGIPVMDRTLTVYIDFKSPYAYLAVEPTRRLAEELGITINWQPFVLDIPSYLGSAKLDNSGKVAEASRSQDQWSGVKYAYYDCRRYANLRGMTIRGTVKIWDTNLAAIGMLRAKGQGDEILQRYIDGIYVPFWKRELDVESIDVVEQVLVDAGADITGFKTFAEGEGAQSNRLIQQNAFDQGIFGVPTYVLGKEKYFGREHLPRVRWQLEGAQGPAPDIEYGLLPGSTVDKSSAQELDVSISLQDLETLLVIPQVLALAEGPGLQIKWYALPHTEPSAQLDLADQSRAGRHRRFRRDNRDRDRNRYIDESLTGDGIELAITSLLRQNDISLQESESTEGVAAAAYLGGTVFRLGEEIFVGRQHLPLIRARLEKAGA